MRFRYFEKGRDKTITVSAHPSGGNGTSRCEILKICLRASFFYCEKVSHTSHRTRTGEIVQSTAASVSAVESPSVGNTSTNYLVKTRTPPPKLCAFELR